MNRIIILLFTAIAITTSCSSFLDYEVPYHGDRLAVHALLTDSIIEVYVSKTAHPLDSSENTWVENATVVLFGNNQKLFTIPQVKQGKYELNVSEIAENIDYHLEVSATGFEKVISTKQQLPPKLDTISTYTELTEYSNQSYYFITKIKSSGKEYVYQTLLDMYGATITRLDSVYLGYSVYDKPADTELTMSSFASTEFYYNIYSRTPDTLRYAVQRVRVYSTDFKKFILSVEQNSDVASGELPLFDYVPPIFSNMKNGFGLFACYREKKKMFLPPKAD
ncbi:MAG TPA: hypothetical protein DCQ31_00750 [Bacteroidales bacterium]|nr:hypothetical protein [Bacteroidales bacterium]